MITHFSAFDLSFIIIGFAFIMVSLAAFFKGKIRLSIFLLICGGFAFRIWMAFIDPFINIWDEQFHAVVARNMMMHPFSPTLYENAVMPFTPEEWTLNHFWLHKPPLFLWQIAIAMKIFGTKYWVVRIPSVVLTTFCIPVLFKMGKLLSGNATGYFSALLFSVTCLQINIVSGFLNTDHNDVIFMCYVLFSFWAWMEFYSSPSKKWILLIGVFSGMAILVKWLPGLLIYAAWFVVIVADKKSNKKLKALKEMFSAFVITVLVSLPWYLYILTVFPNETKATFVLQNRHLNEALDHSGTWLYHFQLLKSDYGWWLVILMPISVFLFMRRKENKLMRLGLVTSIIFVYIFYTIVKTKMPLFCLIVSPLILLMIGEMMADFYLTIKKQSVILVFAIGLGFFTFHIFDIGRIESIHTRRDPKEIYRLARIENKKQFEKAAATLPSKEVVIFNCGGYSNGVACMFYTGFTSYNGMPEEQQFLQLKSRGIKMAFFDDIPLPSYIESDSSVIKLHYKLVRNGF